METTRTNTAWWWVAGAIVVLLLIWAFVRNSGNNAGIPNTGVDDASSTNLYLNGANSTSTNSNSTTNSNGSSSSAATMNAKG